MAAAPPVLLYDGTCGFCAESVQLVLRHDRRRTLRFASLQGAFGAEVRARHPALERVDSVVWVEPSSEGHGERVLVRSDAAIQVARYLGGWFTVIRAGRLVPRFARDGVYDAIARHRHHLLGPGTGPSCSFPPSEARERFLDPVP